MDSQSTFVKKLAVPLILSGMGLLAIYGMGSILVQNAAQKGKVVSHSLVSRWGVSHWIEIYGKAWTNVQIKIEQLQSAEQENAKLRLENSNLKIDLETLRFECKSNHGKEETHDHKSRLSKETGTEVGRTLASIAYKPPADLVPAQLFTLGLSYFKGREDEKAAVIFTTLSEIENGEAYRTAKSYLLTAMAWYRLENFKMAEAYLDEVLKKSENEETLPYQAKARLWKSLIAKKLHKDLKSQYWMREVLDHHPHSPEAKWINPTEAGHGKKED
jgi:hypothetical protein